MELSRQKIIWWLFNFQYSIMEKIRMKNAYEIIGAFDCNGDKLLIAKVNVNVYVMTVDELHRWYGRLSFWKCNNLFDWSHLRYCTKCHITVYGVLSR